MKTKIRAFTALCLCAVALSACGDKVMDFRNAEISNGKMYRQGADEPFSGKVTNVPLEQLINNHAGYFKAMPAVLAGTGTAAPGIVLQGLQAYSNGLLAICDAQFTDGWIDGAMVCSKQRTGEKLLEVQFVKGTLSGPLTFFGSASTASITFQNGLPQGQLTVKSLKTDKPVHTYQFQNGVLNGREEILNEENGAVTSYATYIDGVVEGEIVKFTPDGKHLIYQATMVKNQQHGPEKYFYPSGKLHRAGNWENGMAAGLFQEYDEQGKVIKEEIWHNGVQSDPVNQDPEGCVKQKVDAYHQENGEDRPIMHDQMMEWQEECGLPATGYN